MKKLITICAVLALVLAFGTTAKAKTWNVPDDFQTIQDAIDSSDVEDGDTILVGRGSHSGAIVTKAVEIKGKGGAVIDDGPIYHTSIKDFVVGFYFRNFLFPGGSGATISHLSFDKIVDLPIYSRNTDDVTVEHCTFTSPMQGITNWNGNGWNISHNVINGLVTISGGGIGIFVGTRDFEGATANNNLITHNKITGQVVVSDDEIERYNEGPPYPEAGYSVPGICLMSDRRYGSPAGPIWGNRILKNKVSLTSNNPRNHFPGGIGLSDLGLRELGEADLLDNKIGFNDLRGMLDTLIPEGDPEPQPTAILLVPDELDESNIISRNLGYDADNRGHGVHPKVLF